MPTVAHQRNRNALSFKGILLITSSFSVMAGATVAPALPAMQRFFVDVDHADLLVRLVLTLPALFITLVSPLVGYLTDRFTRKPVLIGSVIVYGLAGASGFVLDSLYLILVGRAVLGLATGGLMTSVTTLITDYYDGADRANFLGIQSGFMGFAGTVFLTLGGLLADVNWRAAFLIYLTALLAVPFLIAILYEPIRSKTKQINTSLPVEAFPISIVAFGYFNIGFIQMVFYSVPIHLPFYLEDIVNASASASGIAIAILSTTFALTSGVFGWFLARFGHVSLLVGGLLIAAASYALLGVATGWWLIIIAMLGAGVGIGLVTPNMTILVANAAPPALRGRALGGSTTSLFLGRFIVPFVTQPMLSATSFGGMYIIIAAMTAVVAAAVLIRRPREGYAHL